MAVGVGGLALAVAAALGALLSARESRTHGHHALRRRAAGGHHHPRRREPNALALSPDGRQLAFVATTDGRQQLWVRPFESADRPAAGRNRRCRSLRSGRRTAASSASFRRDRRAEENRRLGRPGPDDLRRPQLQGAATWGRDGTILFTQLGQGIFRVSADGGTPVRVTKLDTSRRELNHFWPEFLPDGRHFLYMATSLDAEGVRETPSVYVASLDSPDRTPAGSDAFEDGLRALRATCCSFRMAR